MRHRALARGKGAGGQVAFMPEGYYPYRFFLYPHLHSLFVQAP